eukprot:Gb_00833 [translate_table: standard]
MDEMKGITKEDELKRWFMLMLRGATLQWYTSADCSQMSWDELNGAFLDRFQEFQKVNELALDFKTQLHKQRIGLAVTSEWMEKMDRLGVEDVGYCEVGTLVEEQSIELRLPWRYRTHTMLWVLEVGPPEEELSNEK